MFKSKNKKQMYTPVTPILLVYIKVGCKGVYITRTCFHDDSLSQANGLYVHKKIYILGLCRMNGITVCQASFLFIFYLGYTPITISTAVRM